MKLINRINNYFIILAVLFLPINLKLNNIFLGLFVIFSIILFFDIDKGNRWERLKQNRIQIILLTLPFWLNALGLLYTDELKKGIDYTVRAIPFLLIPIIAISQPEIVNKNYKKMGYALVLGCLFVSFFSWGHTIKEIFYLKKPLSDLFGALHSHHKLVKYLGLHATYLSIFIYVSIGFLITQITYLKHTHKTLTVFVVLVLTFFLFHLLSRMSILFFIFSGTTYLIYVKKWKILIGLFLAVLILGFLAYNIKNNYLRDRLFNSLNFLEKDTEFSKKDDRFDRLSASYEVFIQSPVFGYGTAGESKHRKELFKKNKDMVAYDQDFNAHNQFFEYLSTYGIIGGFVYFLFFGNLFWLTYKVKNYFILFILTGLFLACITESIFERSLGVVFTSLLIALLISFGNKKKKTKDY